MASMSSPKASFKSVEDFGSPATTNEQVQSSKDLALWQSILLYPKITGIVVGLALGILLVGYDLVIVGTITALPAFREDFGERHNNLWIIPATWLALWSALGPVGTVIGGVTAGWYQDVIGRRWSLIVGSAISAAGVAVIFIANLWDDVDGRRGAFLAGKILQGISIGILLTTGQTYISEIAPVSLRGSALALIPTSILVGQLVGAVVIFISSAYEGNRSYLIPFASQWPFSAVPLVMAIICPESPPYLIRKSKHDKALRAVQRLHTAKIDANAEFAHFKAPIEHEREVSASTSYLECFRGTNFRRTMIVVFTNMVPSLFGLPLLAQASYFMQVVGMSAANSLIFLILGIGLGLIANGIGVWIVSKQGRRLLTLSSLTVTTVLWFSIGVAGVWSGRATIWYTAATMMAIIVTCGLGVWPATTTLGAEVSSLSLRAKSLGIGAFAHYSISVVMNLVLPYVFNPDAGNLKAKTGFVYAGICGIATIVTWFVVPELKGRSTIEMDEMFEHKVATRAFKTWVSRNRNIG